MKKILITVTLLAILCLSNASRATGIPTVDVVAIAQFLEEYGIQTQELREIVKTYDEITKEYELLEKQYKEWQIITNIDDILTLFESNGQKTFELVGLTDPITLGLQEPVIIPSEIWGSDYPPARNSYVRQQDFIHQNIKKLNLLHVALAAREPAIEALAIPATTKATEKDVLGYQGALLIQNALVQNDKMMLHLLEMQITLGLEALQLEEIGAELTDLKDASEVN